MSPPRARARLARAAFAILSLVLATLPSSLRAATADASTLFACRLLQPAGQQETLSARTVAAASAFGRYRGSVVVRLQAKGAFGGFPSHVEIYPGPPLLAFRVKAAASADQPGQLLVSAGLDINEQSAISNGTSPVLVPVGSDVHAVWTWSGFEHRLYLNGVQVAAKTLNPFGAPQGNLRVLSNAPDQVNGPVHEIAFYNFALSPEQVAADRDQKDAAAFVPAAGQPPSVGARWAPGDRRVQVFVDTGNDLASAVRNARLSVRRDEVEFASFTLPLDAGYGHRIFDLPAVVAGAHEIRASLRDAADVELATVASSPWTLPPTAWLGNTLGLSDAVQAPWTPIESAPGRLRVWGREIDLRGGYGLPAAIESQGRDQLRAPVALEFVAPGGANLPVTAASVSVDSVQPHLARWSGSAQAGRVRVNVSGSLEYDGMVLLRLTLSPPPGETVSLDRVRLVTEMPGERARYLSTANYHGGYWWYPYRSWIPTAPGVVLRNTDLHKGRGDFQFFALFADDRTGLEWFADNLAGWPANMQQTLQEVVRRESGEVAFVCHLANQPFTLSEPVTITFGYAATPMKPLPDDWRSLYVHYSRLADVSPAIPLWWAWETAGLKENAFALQPDNLATWKTQVVDPRVGMNIAPFTNQHVLVPSGPDRQRPDAWEYFQNILGAETDNDGWKAAPTRGSRDYWAWNIDGWLASGGMQALYIDEANYQTHGDGLLAGTGWMRPDGFVADGHLTLGMREQFKRLRQLFLDRGRRPLVWLPVYAMYIPHAFSFVDVASEGEAYMFNSPTAPDWIDVWGRRYLDDAPASEPLYNNTADRAAGGPWLRSIVPAQRFGSIPVFLNYIGFWNQPAPYRTGLRAQYALLGLEDVIPIASELGWYFKTRADFGLGRSGTSFRHWAGQADVTTDRADVKVSYHRRGNRLLLHAANLGEAYAGRVTLDLAALGLAPGSVTATRHDESSTVSHDTNVTSTALAWEADGRSLALTIPRHDFQLVEIASQRAATAPASPSIAPGNHARPMRVALASATTGAVIHYTLDGSDPAAPGALVYTGPFLLRERTTLRARAQATGADASDETGGVYRIDTPTSPFEDWKLARGLPLADEGAGAAAVDADGDGLSLLLEYALGRPAAGPAPADLHPWTGRDVAGRLTLSFRRERAELVYTVFASDDLGAWQPIAVNPGAVGEVVTVSDTLPAAPGDAPPPRRFLRLRVEAP